MQEISTQISTDPSKALGPTSIEAGSAELRRAVDRLRQLYTLPSDGSVDGFLEQHPILVDMLAEAHLPLMKRFGKQVEITLSAPYDDEGWQLLYATVLWPNNADDIARAIDRFQDEWWIPNAGEALQYLSFTYELV